MIKVQNTTHGHLMCHEMLILSLQLCRTTGTRCNGCRIVAVGRIAMRSSGLLNMS